MMATGLAYIWLIYLGVLAGKEEWIRIVHRSYLGLFQLGPRLLSHFLNEGYPIPMDFLMAQWEPLSKCPLANLGNLDKAIIRGSS